MKAFSITGEQVAKLKELVEAVCPQYLLRATQHQGSFLSGHKTFNWWYISDGESELIGWLEFCLRFVTPMVAERYSKHHVVCTGSWALHMISQKLAHEIETINPIDTLYDIFKNPNGYAQGL